MTSSANVRVGKADLVTGGVSYAPSGTALPTDARTVLAEAFNGLGFVGEDGLTETAGGSVEKVKAWGGAVVKVTRSDYAVSFSFTLIEVLNGDVASALYGPDNVETTPATDDSGNLTTVLLRDSIPEGGVWAFDIKDGDAKIRIAVPDGVVTEIGDVTYADASVIAYPVTVEALFDGDLDANAVKMLDDGARAVAAA